MTWPEPTAVAELLAQHDFHAAGEHELQAAIEHVLLAHEVPHQREYSLSPSDRVDFLAGDVGDGLALEVKVAGSRASVLSQLHRYAQHARVSAVLLVALRPGEGSLGPGGEYRGSVLLIDTWRATASDVAMGYVRYSSLGAEGCEPIDGDPLSATAGVEWWQGIR